MFARLTTIEVDPKNAREISRVYHSEVVPVVRDQKGLVDVQLLEPADNSGEFISITTWKSKEDADAYEASGTYRSLVDKLKSFYTSKPVLKVYNLQESRVPAM
jgi:heme-degrading monooxygenase HmoA